MRSTQLSGPIAQVVTVNDYLARRDSEWVGQVHRFLGLRVGLVQQGLDAEERKAAYQADITYVTNSELGFDYLRDNLAQVGALQYHLDLDCALFSALSSAPAGLKQEEMHTSWHSRQSSIKRCCRHHASTCPQVELRAPMHTPWQACAPWQGLPV